MERPLRPRLRDERARRAVVRDPERIRVEVGAADGVAPEVVARIDDGLHADARLDVVDPLLYAACDLGRGETVRVLDVEQRREVAGLKRAELLEEQLRLAEHVLAGLKALIRTAQDADDRIVYETDTGKLFFDSNGGAAGGSIQFAVVSPGLALTNADFFII